MMGAKGLISSEKERISRGVLLLRRIRQGG